MKLKQKVTLIKNFHLNISNKTNSRFGEQVFISCFKLISNLRFGCTNIFANTIELKEIKQRTDPDLTKNDFDRQKFSYM